MRSKNDKPCCPKEQQGFFRLEARQASSLAPTTLERRFVMADPERFITDPETGEQLRIIERPGPETWVEKACREAGIKLNYVEPPKNFVRVWFRGGLIPIPEKEDEEDRREE
jgi:hypothetical protein